MKGIVRGRRVLKKGGENNKMVLEHTWHTEKKHPNGRGRGKGSRKRGSRNTTGAGGMTQ